MTDRSSSLTWWCAVVLSLSLALIIQSLLMGAPVGDYGQPSYFSLLNPLVPDADFTLSPFSILLLVLPGIAAIVVSRAGGILAAVLGVALAFILSLLINVLLTPTALPLSTAILTGLGATAIIVLLANALSALLARMVLNLIIAD